MGDSGLLHNGRITQYVNGRIALTLPGLIYFYVPAMDVFGFSSLATSMDLRLVLRRKN
jgi:hypothetical protein